MGVEKVTSLGVENVTSQMGCGLWSSFPFDYINMSSALFSVLAVALSYPQAGLVGPSGVIGPSGLVGPSGPVQFHQPAWAFLDR
ncbi:hypothetical protein Avbf_14215 [Armadillidium vulgare]|nr:hypothetical protein Avbf_14215 [Armadillidium vulgare]